MCASMDNSPRRSAKRLCISSVSWNCLLLLCLCFKFSVGGEGRRPVYNIAHMVNSVFELEEYLERGANAVESDVTFHGNGTVKNVYHGYPCDCYRVCDEKEDLGHFLSQIRDLSDPNSKNYQKSLTLLFLDLKVSDVTRSQKYKAGEEIAKYLITYLWKNDRNDPKLNVLLSIGHTSDSDAIRGVQDTFTKSHRGTALKRLGFDVGLNGDLSSIRRMWSKLNNVNSNRWQGDGITNCLRPLRDDNRLRQAIRSRDSGAGYMTKVYDWTVDLTTGIRRSLRSGVDGILTNFPERVISVLQEKEFSEKFRLATIEDDPFSRVNAAAMKNSFEPPNMNLYVAAARELTIAFMGYVWDFYNLRLKRPATLFPLIQDLLKKSAPAVREYKSSLKRIFRSRVSK